MKQPAVSPDVSLNSQLGEKVSFKPERKPLAQKGIGQTIQDPHYEPQKALEKSDCLKKTASKVLCY